MRKFNLILVGLVVLGTMTACHSKRDDKLIASDIENKISADSAAQDSHVTVVSTDGQVTLEGTSRTVAAKRKMVSIANAEPGVVKVNDRIAVGQNADSSPAADDSSLRAAATAPPPPPPLPPPPPPPPVVVPAGTILTVRVNQAISTKSVKTGTTFTGSVMTPITLDGKMVIPARSEVTGIVSDAKKAGKFKGGASLTLALDSLTVNGHRYNVVTEYFSKDSVGKGKRTTGMVLGGTGVGAAIGGIAGGGKGAAIGALAGAAAGTVGSMTGNRDIELPAESALTFKLDQSLTLKPDTAQGD